MSYAAKAYANTQAETHVASLDSVDLIVVIYERIFDHLKIGKNELASGRYGIDAFSKATDLLNIGLLACLDYEKGGQIATNLKTVYDWSIKTMLQARLRKSPEMIEDVIDVLTPLYEGWVAIGSQGSSSFMSNQNVTRQVSLDY